MILTFESDQSNVLEGMGARSPNKSQGIEPTHHVFIRSLSLSFGICLLSVWEGASPGVKLHPPVDLHIGMGCPAEPKFVPSCFLRRPPQRVNPISEIPTNGDDT